MMAVIAFIGLGIRYGLDIYTHHGESIGIPNVKHKSFDDAKHILDRFGLKAIVSDTGYVKTLPPDCILEQSPLSGEKVKSGRVIYLIINSSKSPTITLPDIIDNSSVREAMAKLLAMGFKLNTPQFIAGEKDWVYGILVRGKHVVTGDKIYIEDALTIQVGNGMRDEAESINYVDPIDHENTEAVENNIDDFEEVTAPNDKPVSPNTQPN